jgi:hypothetical protein
MEPADRIAVMDDLWSLREEPAATLLVPWHGDVIVEGVPPRMRHGRVGATAAGYASSGSTPCTAKGRQTSTTRGS